MTLTQLSYTFQGCKLTGLELPTPQSSQVVLKSQYDSWAITSDQKFSLNRCFHNINNFG